MRIERILVPILVLQAISVFLLWTLDSLSMASLDVFTLFLAVDLLGFVLVVQFYRSISEGFVERRIWVILVGLAIAALLISSLVIA
jgi:hypothetical protein